MNSVYTRFTYALGVITLLFLAGCGASDSAPQKPAGGPPPAKVVLTAVVEREFVDAVEALGSTRASESVVLTSNVADKVMEIGFADGQFVNEGDLIVRLDDRSERADLNAAQARLRERRQALERTENLIRKKVVSQAELDVNRAEYAAARAEVESLRAALADRAVLAPFSGRVGLREISVGALVQPGDRITTLSAINPLKIDFTVPAIELAWMQPGLSIRARTAAFGERVFEGELASIDTEVDATSRSILARAFVPNPEFLLKPGMFMELELISRRRQAAAVPEAALVSQADQHYVYLVENGSAQKQAVTIGSRDPGWVEISEGLAVGDQVVFRGLQGLADGRSVQVLEGALGGEDSLTADSPGSTL